MDSATAHSAPVTDVATRSAHAPTIEAASGNGRAAAAVAVRSARAGAAPDTRNAHATAIESAI